VVAAGYLSWASPRLNTLASFVGLALWVLGREFGGKATIDGVLPFALPTEFVLAVLSCSSGGLLAVTVHQVVVSPHLLSLSSPVLIPYR